MSTTGKWILGIVVAFAGMALVVFAIAMFSFVGALTTASSPTYEESTGGSGTDRVAVIRLEEAIMDASEVVRQLQKYRKRNSVKAIVLRLDSPGGGVVPSHEIYEEVNKTRKLGTPVVVSMGSVAASGAYYIACAASLVVANPGTITGSIGVVSTFPNFKGLMDKIGVEQTTIKSGEFKDVGNPARAMTERERSFLQSSIDNVYGQFLRIVSTARKLPEDSVRALADGRIYTGEQAFAAGLVDTLGTFQTAVLIAGTLGKISGEPRITEEVKRESLLDVFMGTRSSETLRRLEATLRSTPPVEYRMLFQ
jgi:protease IV